jgi:hypothetical protein
LVVFDCGGNVAVKINICKTGLSGCHRSKQVKTLSCNSLVKPLLHQITKVVCSLLIRTFMSQNPFEESFITERISWQSEDTITMHLTSGICVLADRDNVAFNIISTHIIVTEAAN